VDNCLFLPSQIKSNVADLVVYEHPLNERIRIFLRLEHLLLQIDHFVPMTDIWSSRAAIYTLLDVTAIFARSDLKTEILKELERHSTSLERIRRQPDVDIEALGAVLERLEQSIHQVYRLEGQIAHKLKKNEFLSAIAQRTSIPGGNCSFDLPQFHHWLNQPHEVRQRQMENWLQELAPVRKAIILLLELVRNSSHPSWEIAKSGLYLKTLDSQTPAQMVRIGLPRETPLFVEVSGNKNRFNIRFLEPVESGRPIQASEDVRFQFTSCIL